MSADDEIAQRIRPHSRQPDQDARIADVVLLQVVGVGIVFEQRVPSNRESPSYPPPTCFMRLFYIRPCTLSAGLPWVVVTSTSPLYRRCFFFFERAGAGHLM